MNDAVICIADTLKQSGRIIGPKMQVELLRFPLTRFQLFFRVERQLDHALKKLIGRQSCKIPEHEFLHVQPHEVAQLQRPVPCRKDKIPVSTVDHDDVALGVEAAAPELAGRALEGVTEKPSRVDDRGGHSNFQTIRDCNQRFGRHRNLALYRGDFQAGEPWGHGSSVLDLLIRDTFQGPLAFEQFPGEG
jgi:hypothetical protein